MVDSVVFCPVHSTSLEVMTLIANYIHKNSKNKVVFLLGSPKMIKAADKLENLGFKVITVDMCEADSSILLKGIKYRLKSIFQRWLLKGYYTPDGVLYICSAFFRRATNLHAKLVSTLSGLNPVSVIIPDDRSIVNGFLPALIKACRTLQVECIIPPMAYASTKENLLFAGRRKTQRVFEKSLFLEKYSDNCVLDETGDRPQLTSFYPELTTELLYRLEMLPSNPWVIGGGGASLVLVDSKVAALRCIKHGCDSKKIIVTGHPSHDVLFDILRRKHEIRHKLVRKYDFNKKHLTIVSLPQLAEHNFTSWEKHWQEIHFLCDSFSNGVGDILISLHPKMQRKDYAFIEKEYGLSIADEALHELLPVVDSFFATFSSTVEWAVLCEIPTIVFDYYNFNYTMYDDYQGVLVTNNRDELPILLNNIQLDNVFLDNLAKGHTNNSSSLSPFDGKCMARISKVCTRIDKKHPLI